MKVAAIFGWVTAKEDLEWERNGEGRPFPRLPFPFPKSYLATWKSSGSGAAIGR